MGEPRIFNNSALNKLPDFLDLLKNPRKKYIKQKIIPKRPFSKAQNNIFFFFKKKKHEKIKTKIPKRPFSKAH